MHYANESIYRIWLNLSAVLWGAAMFMLFYGQADPWVQITVGGVLIFITLSVVTGLLLKKGTVKQNNETLFALQREWKLVVLEFLWNISSAGVIVIIPKLALAGLNGSYGVQFELEKSPALLLTGLLHLAGVVVSIIFISQLAKKERS